ncbi:thrombospondin type 3 repeat-containing protein [Puniceicoccus vermicola]|uniref:Uncharacterized protein n=1 Tax=Puniceicoccus vermicola TaxID=388746 RepID=A0A7X1E5M0_9BACT|nr:thrombospondin type 3 repeat-containing protein [Puniceicoccus vermicola]MBC2603306.1 hypothetical protein [Puniceicoccus vermicola]
MRAWLAWSVAGIGSLVFFQAASGLDEDNDGMSDVFSDYYELETGSAGDDSDGDGQTNAVESEWGTDPHDPFEYGISKVERMDEETVRVTIPTVIGKRYRFSISLDLEEWEPIGEEFVGSGGLEHLLIDFPVAGTNRLFWRGVSLGEVDNDLDGLGGYEESLMGTSDELEDSDDDELSDLDEFLAALDPLGGFVDSDLDGFSDDFEIANNMDKDSPDGTAPTVRFLNASQSMNFLEGESYEFRVEASESDLGGIETVEVRMGSKHSPAASISVDNQFSALLSEIDSSEETQVLTARAYGEDGSRGESNDVSVDVAEVERWLSVVRSRSISWYFARRLNGEETDVYNQQYYRGDGILKLKSRDGSEMASVPLQNYDEDVLIIFDDVEENSLILQNSLSGFPLHSTMIWNHFGRDIYGTISYDDDEVEFAIPNGEYRIVEPLRPYPQNDESWKEDMEIMIEISGSEHISYAKERDRFLGERTLVFVYEPARPGSIRAGVGIWRVPDGPRIIATPFRQGTYSSPGARRHFLQNQDEGNLPLRVNDDFDDELSVPDFNDTVLGEEDDDILTINVKLNLRGLTEWDHFEITPSSDKIRLYYRDNAGNPVLMPLDDGSYVSTLIDGNYVASQLKSESGLDFFVEGMEPSDSETVEFRAAEDDGEYAVGGSETVKIGPIFKVELEFVEPQPFFENSDRVFVGNDFQGLFQQPPDKENSVTLDLVMDSAVKQSLLSGLSFEVRVAENSDGDDAADKGAIDTTDFMASNGADPVLYLTPDEEPEDHCEDLEILSPRRFFEIVAKYNGIELATSDKIWVNSRFEYIVNYSEPENQRYDRPIALVRAKYDMPDNLPRYNESLSDDGFVGTHPFLPIPVVLFIELGPSAYENENRLASTWIHENVHLNQGRDIIRKIAAGRTLYEQHVADGSNLSTIPQADKDSITEWIVGESEAYFTEQDNYDETCLNAFDRSTVQDQLDEFSSIYHAMNP